MRGPSWLRLISNWRDYCGKPGNQYSSLPIKSIDKQSSLADDLHRLGIRQIVPISAEHGRGVDDLLDAILGALPEKAFTTEDAENAGKIHRGRTAESKPPPSERRWTKAPIAKINPKAGNGSLADDRTESRRPTTQYPQPMTAHPPKSKWQSSAIPMLENPRC